MRQTSTSKLGLYISGAGVLVVIVGIAARLIIGVDSADWELVPVIGALIAVTGAAIQQEILIRQIRGRQ
jgi:hypothetical protein